MVHLGFPLIAEASSGRAMDRTDRMDSMEAAEEAEEAAAARGIYFAPPILTVRGQVAVAAVKAARAAKAVEVAAAGEGRLESTFIIMVPMAAL
jgi:phosphopantothenate synthetase